MPVQRAILDSSKENDPCDSHADKLKEMFAELHVSSEHLDAPIWTVNGELSPDAWFPLRFGSRLDRFMSRLLRLVAAFDALWIPFLLSFGRVTAIRQASDILAVQLVEVTTTCLYAFGAVVLSLITSSVDLASGEEFVDRSTICCLRLRKVWFWCDFISCLGGFWWCTPYLVLAGLRLLRLWRLPSSSLILYDLTYATVTSTTQEFLECLFAVWLVAHFFGCAWFVAVTFPFKDIGELLDISQHYFKEQTWHQYIQCLGFGAQMLVGWSGPPPSHPTLEMTTPEVVFYVFTAPFASMYMGYIFGKLLVLLERSSQTYAKHSEQVEKIGGVLSSLSVPTALRQRVLQYHTYLSVHNVNKTSYEIVFEGLSASLHVEIKLFLFERLVMTAAFFRDVPPNLIMKIIVAFEEEVYSPGDLICKKGDNGNEMFFIIKGACDVLIDDDCSVCVATKTVGDYFGEVALVFENTPRTAWIRARVFCVLAKLTRAVFMETMSAAPLVREKVLHAIKARGGIKVEERICSCGNVLMPDAVFCRRCGSKWESQGSRAAETEMTPLLQTDEPTQNGATVYQQLSARVLDNRSASKSGKKDEHGSSSDQIRDLQSKQLSLLHAVDRIGIAVARIEGHLGLSAPTSCGPRLAKDLQSNGVGNR